MVENMKMSCSLVDRY